MPEEKQLNIRLTSEEFNSIKKGAEDSKLTMKDYILSALSDPNKRLEEKKKADEATAKIEKMEDLKQPPKTQVIESIIDAHGPLGGFDLYRCAKNLRNLGLTEDQLSEQDMSAILSRYRDHANYWGYDGDRKREELEDIGRVLKCDDPSEIVRLFYDPRTYEILEEEAKTSVEPETREPEKKIEESK